MNFVFPECRVLSESPYPSNLDFMNISIVPKHSFAPQCSLVDKVRVPMALITASRGAACPGNRDSLGPLG